MIKESESPNVPRPSELLTSYEHYKLLKASNFDMRFVRGVAFPSDFPNLDHRPCDGEKFLYGHDEPAMTQSLWVKYLLENCEFLVYFHYKTNKKELLYLSQVFSYGLLSLLHIY